MLVRDRVFREGRQGREGGEVGRGGVDGKIEKKGEIGVLKRPYSLTSIKNSQSIKK